MQIERTKLIFIMNIGVLDFFKFASRMPQIAQILVSTFKIFRTPLEISFFFHEQFQALRDRPFWSETLNIFLEARPFHVLCS